MKVEDVWLCVVVPDGCLVVKLENALHGLGLVPLDQAIVGGAGLEGHPLALRGHAGQYHSHPPRTLEPQNVRLIHHTNQLLALAWTILQGKRKLNEDTMAKKQKSEDEDEDDE